MGGLPRRATYIKNLGAQGLPIIIFDTGNTFADKPLSEASLGGAQAKAELILDAMEKMGYAALAVGEMDLYLGKERLQALGGATTVRFLSANVLDGSGRPVFPPSVILELDGARVGVLGLTSRNVDAALMEERWPGAWIDDPVKAASLHVPRLDSGCDLVVALSNLGIDQDEALARAVPGIDVIVGGKSRRWMRTPTKVESTLVTNGFFQGRSVGSLTVNVKPQSQGWADGQELDFLVRQIRTLESGRATAPGSTQSLAGLRARNEELSSRSRYDGEMVNLTPEIADDPEIAGMIAAYRERLAELAKTGAAPPSQDLPATRYLGAARCAECHPSRHAFWAKTSHSRAYSSLVPKNAVADPDCLPCHVTGYLHPTGYSPADPRAALRGVQCESCHGMGSLHASRPEEYKLVSGPTAPHCLSCHTSEQDDDFVYNRDRPLVCGEGQK